MKLGFDIHGVIDTFGVFQDLISKLIEDEAVEIHVVTGLSRKEANAKIGHLIDLSRAKYFSIADYLTKRPDVKVTWDENGLPWADQVAWDHAKANYCQDVGIDILFDDSPVYAETFDNIATIYCQIHNPNRKQFKTRDNYCK